MTAIGMRVRLTRGRWLMRLVCLLALVCAPVVAGAEQARTEATLAPTVAGPAAAAGTAAVPEAAAATLSPADAREDLTVFFTIGVVIDLLLLTAFLVWAVGQWRKSRK